MDFYNFRELFHFRLINKKNYKIKFIGIMELIWKFEWLLSVKNRLVENVELIIFKKD